MEAKDTVMSDEQITPYLSLTDRVGSVVVQQDDAFLAQAEISFKAGIREVVEWIQKFEKQNPAHYSHIQVEKYEWQAKLKEWGLM